MSRTTQMVILALVVMIAIAACVAGAFLVIRSLTQPEAAPTPEPGADGSWERIKAAGMITVGTSADYPPFEYLTSESQIDGFDIALMDEIGRRLGVQVEYRNLAFDGLENALMIGQIDVAIAAISVTPERQAIVDFTNVYFVGEDGILAREDAGIDTIEQIDQIASLRVGVQRATVHEDWVRTELLDRGLMPADNLFVYENASDAVRDLKQQRLDLVLLDAQPAESFASEGGAQVIGRGLNQQRFALALPKGANSLKAEINRVLTELHNEGVVAELARSYLGLDQLLPTPSPAPTSTPGEAPVCVDGLALVQHLNHDDQNMVSPPEMQPGQAFTKGWQVENTGTCAWDSSYQLVYAGGSDPAASMGGQPVPVQGEVPPGGTYDIYVDLVAPLGAGTYQGFWHMENGESQAPSATSGQAPSATSGQAPSATSGQAPSATSGQAPSATSGRAFGERLPVGIKVLAAPTATPAPTQTPVPGIVFAVDRDQVKAGECIIFSWKVDNAKAVYFYVEGSRWQDHGVPSQSRQQECPPVTTTYYLRIIKPDNSVAVRQIAVYVEAAPQAPQIARFTVDPPNQIALGQCASIRWGVEGEVDQVNVLSNDITLWEDAPLTGNLEDCPAGPATVAYRIEVHGPGGTSQQVHNLRVVEPATATPVPTGSPELPVIHAFSVSPNQIAAGECVGLSWSAGGNASLVRILRNGAEIVFGAVFVGQEMDCLEEVGNYVYRLEAYNLGGQSVSQEQTATVSEAMPENPLAGTHWQATSYYDAELGGMTPVLSDTLLTASFSADGRLNGSAGCNTYSARYLVDGGALSITSPSTTNIACNEPEGIMEQEATFLNTLASATMFSLEANQLTVQDDSGQVVLEFIQLDQ